MNSLRAAQKHSESMANLLVTDTMDDSKKNIRASNKLILETIESLLEIGVVPRSVTVGDIKIEVASYQPKLHDEATTVEPRKAHGHMARLAQRMAERSAKAGN
jgi:hypothetical protein